MLASLLLLLLQRKIDSAEQRTRPASRSADQSAADTFFVGQQCQFVRVKKVEQTALGCQQPQLLPTMLPIFILSSICFRIEGHNLKRTINELAQNKQFFRTESKANFYIFPNSLLT